MKSCISDDDKVQVMVKLKELEIKLLNIEAYLENHRKTKELENMMRSVSTVANGGTIIYLIVKTLGWF